MYLLPIQGCTYSCTNVFYIDVTNFIVHIVRQQARSKFVIFLYKGQWLMPQNNAHSENKSPAACRTLKSQHKHDYRVQFYTSTSISMQQIFQNSFTIEAYCCAIFEQPSKQWIEWIFRQFASFMLWLQRILWPHNFHKVNAPPLKQKLMEHKCPTLWNLDAISQFGINEQIIANRPN